MAWKDDLPALQERNRREREERAPLTAEWDRRAAVRRETAAKALRLLEASDDMNSEEVAVIRSMLAA